MIKILFIFHLAVVLETFHLEKCLVNGGPNFAHVTLDRHALLRFVYISRIHILKCILRCFPKRAHNFKFHLAKK